MTNRPRGASGRYPYNAAASGLRQRVSLADFTGCSLPRFGSIAHFPIAACWGRLWVGPGDAALDTSKSELDQWW